MRPGRILFWLILASIVAIATYWLLRPAAIMVETATVTSGRFVASVTADGRTRVRERYVISAPASGRIERVRLKPGDRIEKDALVEVLRAAQPALVDARARAELEEWLGAAEAQVEEAEALLARARIAQEKATPTSSARAACWAVAWCPARRWNAISLLRNSPVATWLLPSGVSMPQPIKERRRPLPCVGAWSRALLTCSKSPLRLPVLSCA